LQLKLDKMTEDKQAKETEETKLSSKAMEEKVELETKTEKPEEKKQEPLKEFKGLLENVQREKNPALDREEIKALIKANRTPSKEEAKKLLASELKIDQDLMVVKHIYSAFGSQEFNIQAYLYTNKETFEKLEKERQRKKTEEKLGQEKKKQKPKPEEKVDNKKETKTEAKKEEKQN